jgi:two-component system phosphate regulon sensor histidine kinase PhoR
VKRIAGRGLVAPGVVAAGTLVVALLAGSTAALVVLACGAACVVGWHVLQAQRLHDWAAGPLAAPVPEARGVWGDVYTALHRRVRSREARQRELGQVLARFREAAAAIPDGIVVLDAEQRIEWANPQALAQLGLDLRKDARQPIANLVRQPEFLRYLEAADYSRSALVPSARQAGHLLALQLVPFGLEEKLLLSRDVTEVEAVARMRREFIANVSHELKTPLTVVSGFIETLQDVEVEPAQRARFLGLMQEQARNMQRLVSDLLTLSALESDQQPPADEQVPVGALVDALARDAEGLSQGAHAIRVERQGEATILGSREELASAFSNLVTNAVRYTQPGGSITLSWHVDADGSGVFAVADTGIGIAPAHLARLTERFYRVDRGRSRASGGTGLGLAIVKHVLLRHQAELAIASEPGRGSTFSVRLPARRVTAQKLHRERAGLQAGNGPP